MGEIRAARSLHVERRGDASFSATPLFRSTCYDLTDCKTMGSGNDEQCRSKNILKNEAFLLCLSLSVSLSVSVSLSLSCSVSLALSLSASVCLSVCLSLSLSAELRKFQDQHTKGVN